ncbi:glycosyltransferase [Tropicimonas sp. IMCC6043]|uniref:glycosyltransferase n=1 Tax=Tropicimonas sp. IMCC6043 TaxID=2510645 RepID=UPI00101D90B4|nr:glycosyltransferase [Tropicimonas sp. IMCC6043]RYH11130.1 glycosyltransferase [Tropicimonas sp. IMCC6043]
MTHLIRIAMLSKADARGGGASRVADDLYAGLADADDLAIDRFVGKLTPTPPPGYRPVVSRFPGLVAKLRRRAARRGWVDHTPYELPFLDPGIRSADIVHAHDISTVLAPRTLDHLAGGHRRVIWTLHDMSALTGGCLYPLGCSAWRTRCGACPMLGQWPLRVTRDRTGEMQERRLAVLSAGRVEIVTPSRWLARRVSERAPGAAVRVIPNGVALDIFRPDGSPPDVDGPPRMLFIANHIGDLRKGGPYVSEIRRHLARTGRRMELLLVGGGEDGARVETGPLTLSYLGRFDDRAGLAAAYRRAEALLLPTHADNFPLVMLEAMACGLPVFAFDTGGIGEAVDAEVGALVPPGEIVRLIDDYFAARAAGALPGLGHAARARVEAQYSMERFLAAHAALYREAGGPEPDPRS